MGNAFKYLCILLFLLSACGVHKSVHKDKEEVMCGQTDPTININTPQVQVPYSGGTYVITNTGKQSWLLNSVRIAYGDDSYFTCYIFHGKPFHLRDSVEVIERKWFVIETPWENDYSFRCTLKPNDTDERRRVKVYLTIGNWHGRAEFTQEAAPPKDTNNDDR